MFKHHHTVTSGQRNGTTRAAFADDGGDHWRWQIQTSTNGTGNGFSLTAFFGAAPRIGAGGIDKAENRKAEAAGGTSATSWLRPPAKA